MKTALQILMLYLGCSLSGSLCAERQAAGPWLPPPELVGDWKEITGRFMKWEIVAFDYAGSAADGGSQLFEFKTSDGAEFDVVVACEPWWTQDDRKNKRQPILLEFEGRFYRVAKGDKTESRLLEMLRRAASKLEGEGFAHPKYIKRLAEIVNAPIQLRYQGWPLDRLEVEEPAAEWDTINERFKKWEGADYLRWDLLSDEALIFRFENSDDSEFGVVVSLIYPEQPEDPFAERDRNPIALKIFLHHEKRLYRVDKMSEPETRLLMIIDQSIKSQKGEGREGRAHSNYLERLRSATKLHTVPYDYIFWPKTNDEGRDQ